MLPFNSPNAAALWLAPVIFILLDSSLPRWPRNVLAILGIGALLVTRSLGGMLAFALAGLLSAYALYYQKHEPRRLWLLFGAAIVLVLSFASLTGLFNQSLKKDGQTSFQARYEIWTTAVGIGRAHPFWGIGPNRFEDIYPKTVNGYFVDPIEWSVPQPHSLYLATWLSSGLLGLVSLLTLIGYACYLAIRRQRYFLFAALVAILVHGLVDTSYWKNDLAIVFFFLLAAVCQGDNIPVAKEGSLS
jgi:O-antigen ligase